MIFIHGLAKMTSLPCYEILGLDRGTEQTGASVEAAYNRLKEIVGGDLAWLTDVDEAYQVLRSPNTRSAYIMNWTPLKESEWRWVENEDEDGVLRSVVRKTKDGRKNEWEESDEAGKREIKKNKKNDRRGERDKRRGAFGYDD